MSKAVRLVENYLKETAYKFEIIRDWTWSQINKEAEKDEDLIRINNDINGNPRVEIRVFKNYQSDEEENITKQFKGVTGRFYKKSQKIITQCFEAKILMKRLVDNYKSSILAN